MKKNYLNVELCKKCGGKCCKHMSGIAYPEDFKNPLKEGLIEAFKSGKWVIDWYEGDPTDANKLSKAYFVRPAIKGNNKLFDPAWGGECIFLTETGCTLKPEERPMTCRMLEPVTLNKCVFHGAESKATCAIAWLPYTKVILDAAKELDKDVEDAAVHDTPNTLEMFLTI